jgi:hypothetical protein
MKTLLTGLASLLGLGSALGLNAGPAVASKADQMRVANCLKRLGFRRVLLRINGPPQRVWVESTLRRHDARNSQNTPRPRFEVVTVVTSAPGDGPP